MTTVGDVAAALEAVYPPELAESWDRVGLAVGSAGAPVHRVGFCVDVTAAVVAEAAERGADLLVAHHPLLLRGIHAVDLDTPKGALVGDLLRSGIAAYVAHTNADLPPRGTADTLARAVGIVDPRPLASPGSSAAPRDKLVTFVPADHVEALLDALAAVGAGQIGAYERCAFTTVGEGTFRAPADGHPYAGRAGEVSRVPEVRVELVVARARRAAAVEALLAVHPYEEPAYDVLELAGTAAPDTGLGRVGRLAGPTTFGAFAATVRAALPPTPRGLLLSGDPDRPVETVAVQAGAGDDLLDRARAVGADVYVTSDLRHHPALDARAGDGPALIDIPHWAAESLWLPEAERVVASAVAVDTYISAVCTDPWTARLT